MFYQLKVYKQIQYFFLNIEFRETTSGSKTQNIYRYINVFINIAYNNQTSDSTVGLHNVYLTFVCSAKK